MGAPAGQPGTGSSTPQTGSTLQPPQTNTGSSGGSKGTGQPMNVGYSSTSNITPMGTPIIQGKSYLSPSNTTINSPTNTDGPDPNLPLMAANGTTDVQPRYLSNGTTGNDDPWAWVSQQRPAAPLAANIQPSQEQVSGPPPQDPLTQMAEAGAVNAAAKGMEAGYKGYQAANAAQAAMAPLSANTVIGASAPAMSVAPTVAAPAAAALTEAGLLTAAPAMSTAAGAALGAGGTAAAAPAAASALGTGAAAGGQAALAAMGPVGWAIGAGLLAKKMGIF